MDIRNLRTAHLENPLGFAMDAPLFTWSVENAAGKRQTAARIQISVQPDFSDILFDSGFRTDISSLGYTPDIDLSPRTRYFWRVEIQSDAGEDCVSPAAWFETAKMDEPWQAKWIASPLEKDTHVIFRKKYSLKDVPVVRARAYAIGLGLYEMEINGSKAGDDELAPFYYDYANWLQYQTYDVTDMLRSGSNTVSMHVGNGWYKGRFGFEENFHDIYGDRFIALAEIRVDYADGTSDVIGTDTDWLCHASPVLKSNIYDGEEWDARLELPRDTLEGFIPAEYAAAPSAPLYARKSPSLRICDTLKPRLIHTPAGEQVLDFGQVISGWVKFECALPAGQKVYLQYGELLQNDCFYRDNLRSARAEYTYISNGMPAVAYPRFTFYGFRFVKVQGMDANPEAFTACVLHSDLQLTGSIETSNPKVNRLFKNALWSQMDNFVDVPTDCPQRDERMGWTGDAHVFTPTACFNMYSAAFYDKYLFDMLGDQKHLDGAVPHVVPDVINRTISTKCGQPETWKASAVWADAATGIPWALYLFYGDKSMLARHYENMKLWTDWIYRQDVEVCGNRRLWTCGSHYGDWLALDNPDHTSCFGGTDPYYIASAFYYRSTLLTAKAASVLGLTGDAELYSARAEEIRSAMRLEFFTPTGRIAIPTQTGLLLALALDIVPDEFRERAVADLKNRLAMRNWHLDTGFVGTYFLCPTLSGNGLSGIAYTLLLNEDFPSWLYEVNMGATTIWERWNSVLPNGLVSDTGMNSMNHYSYGAVVEWMYRFMAGLNPSEAQPGFKYCRITPRTDPRFDHVHASYDSASGIYEASWERKNGGIEYTFVIPFDCTADFFPESGDQPVHLEAGRHVFFIGQ